MYEFPVLGQINFYRFVPLDNTYTNTLHFKTREKQLEYFKCNNDGIDHNTPYSGGNATGNPDTILKLTYTNQTYTRNERQYIRVESNAQMLMDCNYLAYQNRNFGNNWFFAFVVAVEYINDYVAEVVFELDVMQTFMWNFELRDCFVLREHVKDDRIGRSLTAEPFDGSLMVRPSQRLKTGLMDNYSISIWASFDWDDILDRKPKASYKAGVPSMLDVQVVSINEQDIPDTLDTINTLLSEVSLAGKLDGIIAANIFPSEFSGDLPQPVTRNFSISTPRNISGYIPKNNKLFTYPYNFLHVDCGDNNTTYRYEFFDGDYSSNKNFKIVAVPSLNPSILAVPMDYDRVNDENYPYALTMGNFPQVALSGNAFTQWLAQNSGRILASAIVATGSIAIGSYMAGAAMEAQGLANAGRMANWNGNIAFGNTPPMSAGGAFRTGVGLSAYGANRAGGLIGEAISAKFTPPIVKTTETVQADVATRTRDFYFYKMQLTSEYAEIVDRFFSQFGYAVGKLKRPEILDYDNCRSKWNFIQAINCNFHWDLFSTEGKGTSVPIKYMAKIEEIFANGITFWKNPLEVGHYLTETGQLKDNP